MDIRNALADPRRFRDALRIECEGRPRQLSSVIEPWQADDFAALDSGWQVVAGRAPTCGVPIMRGYLERPRGHSKTTDLATMALYPLVASLRPVRGYWLAGDRDQAALGLDAIGVACRLNKHLGEVLEVQRTLVRNRQTGSELAVLSADANTSFGLLPDFVVADELSHWAEAAGEELFGSLISAAAKKRNCMFVVISNAGRGMGSSWQWHAREAARLSDDWYFSRLEGPQARWITQAALAEQEQFLPPTVYARLWLNAWSTGAGDFLDPQALKDCITLRGPMGGRPDETWAFVGGLDLAATRDHSAFVVLGTKRGTGRVVLADCQSWAPPKGGEIDLKVVESAVLRAHQKFHLTSVQYDPYQALMMAQSLRRRGVNTEQMTFTGANLTKMAAALMENVNGRAISLYDDPALIRDMQAITIAETGFGFRIKAARTSDGGHCDRAIALSIALPAAVELAHHRAFERRAPSRVARTDAAQRFGVQLDRTGNRRSTSGEAQPIWPYR